MSKQGDESQANSTPDAPVQSESMPQKPVQKSMTGTSMKSMELTTQREVTGWYVYDLANSPFYQVLDVMTKVFLKRMAEVSASRGNFPTNLMSAGSYPAAIVWSTAALQTVCLLSFAPYGDFGNRRKQLLQILTWVGSGIVMMNVFCVSADMWSIAGALRVCAGCCHLLANTYYTAYLPLLAGSHWGLEGLVGSARRKREAELSDELSAKGFMLGYVGGISMQIVTFVVLFSTEKSDGTDMERLFPISICLSLVGIWWSVFSIFSFRRLKTRPGKPFPEGSTCMKTTCLGWTQTADTFCTVISFRDTLLFLISYFLWSDALNTIVSVAVLLLDDSGSKDSTVILNSIIAIAGGLVGLLAFSKLQQVFGITNKVMLMCQLVVAGVVSIAGGLGAVTSLGGFGLYLVLGPIMLMLGSLQANARSLFSSLSPLGKEAAMFSFYTITDKGSTLIGALVIGVVHTMSGSYVGVFWYTMSAFLLSVVILVFVDIERGMQSAGKLEAAEPEEPAKADGVDGTPPS